MQKMGSMSYLEPAAATPTRAVRRSGRIPSGSDERASAREQAAIRSTRAAPPILSGDFSAAAELKVRANECSFPGRLYKHVRYSYGAERFARSPTICLLEHKLFVAAWLRSFLRDTAAAPAIIYGGLQQQLPGSWPAFSEAELVRALEKRLAQPGGHRFVLKAATEYGSRQLLLMSKCEWERGRWNAFPPWRARRAQHARQGDGHLNDYNGVADPEGVERRGVVLMERYPPFVEEGGCDARELMVEGVELKVKDPLWIELKVFVVFGELTSATIYRVTPQLVTMPIYFLPDGRIERYGGRRRRPPLRPLPPRQPRRGVEGCGGRRDRRSDPGAQRRGLVSPRHLPPRRWRRRASTRSRIPAGAAKIRGPGCGSSAHTGRAASVPSPARRSGGRSPPPPRCRRRRGSHRTNQCRGRARAASCAPTTSPPRIARCFAPRNTLSRVSISILP